jgi:hypothetical protein
MNKNSPQFKKNQQRLNKYSRWLTPIEKKTFTRELVVNGYNAKKAYQVIRPEVSEKTANQLGNRIKKRVDIQQLYQETLQRMSIEPEEIIQGLLENARQGKGYKATAKDSINAYSKLHDILIQANQQNNQNKDNLEALSLVELTEHITKLHTMLKDLQGLEVQEAEILDTK